MFQDRCKPDIRRMKQWIDDGVLGKVLMADARSEMVPAPEVLQRFEVARNAGAGWWWALINQAVHTVDLLLWMLGDAVEVQAAWLTCCTNRAEDKPRVAQVQIRRERRAAGDYGRVSWLSASA